MITDPEPGLRVGDRAPNFFLADHRDVTISLYDKVKGGHILLFFYPSYEADDGRRELDALSAALPDLVGNGCHVFVIGGKSADDANALRQRLALSDAFTVADPGGKTAAKCGCPDGPAAFVLDPNQRVLERLESGPVSLARRALDAVRGLPAQEDHWPGMHAPILLIPNVFSPAECRYLIAQFWTRGNEESGTYRVEDGSLVHAPNYGAKRRRDHHVVDDDLLGFIGGTVQRRVIPEIHRAFQTRVTGAEEFKIVCYDSEPGGYFRMHRDNTAPQTLHRRFAMTLALNAEEYEGGVLRFPEFGHSTYKPTTGMAVVFSASLLHEATDVIGGHRFMLLSFLYDAAGDKQREALRQSVQRAREPVLA